MNRNVFWRNPDGADPADVDRMNRFWGDESWREAAYDTSGNLFGYPERTENDAVMNAFRERLKSVGGFRYVPEPIPMRNSIGAIVYFLFFASQSPVAAKIVRDIFNKYRNRMAP